MNNVNASGTDHPGQPQGRSKVTAVSDMERRSRQANFPAPGFHKAAGAAGKLNKKAAFLKRGGNFNGMRFDAAVTFCCGDKQQPGQTRRLPPVCLIPSRITDARRTTFA